MKKFLSLVLALVMTMSLVTISAGATDFTDDDKITYEEAVNVISAIGVVDGYTDDSFRPQGSLTRGAAAKIICNMILGPTTAAELSADTAPFKDVPVDHTFAGYIAYCAKEGIISGYADGSFRPAGSLTGYAFMKMLLGALNYDADVEQYTGPNWSINVAKRALNIGLNNGLEGEFNGVKAVNREEAALYAFNTLVADLVEYDSKTNVTVGGAAVVISGSEAKAQRWNNSATKIENIKEDNYIQFAEQYFTKLRKTANTDDFERPAHTWTYNKKELGTYVDKDKLVESYTKGVTGKTIYELLGAVAIRDNDLDTYLDGAVNDGIDKDDLVRSNNSSLSGTGTGVLTEVYLDTDKDVITIVSINTYLAQATAKYSTSKEYAPLAAYVKSGTTTTTYNVDVEDVPAVADVEEDGWYLLNISYKDGSTKGYVVELQAAEVMEDSTVTKFTRKNPDDVNDTVGGISKLTVGGTQYSAAAKAYYDPDVLNQYNADLLTDASYNVYVDQYGNFIGVDLHTGAANYVFITGYDRSKSNLSVTTAKAAGIFLDGTMDEITVNVKATNKNIKKAVAAAKEGDEYFTDREWNNHGENDGTFSENRWYTYTKTEAGVYTLKPAVRMTATDYTVGEVIDTANVDVVDNILRTADTDAPIRAYGEDATVFLTVEEDVVDTTDGNKYAITDVTGVYTGVQSVDLEIIESNHPYGAEVYTVYDSDYYIIGAIVMGEAKGNTANIAYIVSNSLSEERRDGTYYWEFDVVMGGELQTVTAKSKYANTIDIVEDEINGGDRIVELRFDGDYVVSIKEVTKIYDNDKLTTQKNVKGNNVYAVDANDFELNLKGRTMYVTKDRSDVGLALVTDAKAVVIQKENGKSNVKTAFDSVAEAIGHLAEPKGQENTDGQQYDGAIIAAVDSKGAAKWVVFVNDSELVTGGDKANTSSGNEDMADLMDIAILQNAKTITVTTKEEDAAKFTALENEYKAKYGEDLYDLYIMEDYFAVITDQMAAEGYKVVAVDMGDGGAISAIDKDGDYITFNVLEIELPAPEEEK